LEKEYTVNDFKLLTEVALENNLNSRTLHDRIKTRKLVEGKDYRSCGERRGLLLSPTGIKKIL